ncbi:hypothetical protein GUJ93_ZPchr0001g33172 [Zizania palustris]|uniref:Uncharacterized protein n=1 Tax=Zizania palustris TaxID=103762 RepID=A0A8J5RFN3_ZIZPA|nr:hypothetical protein GUJ93_ZPchr0001g33172 [Zizania palustris]
MWGLGGRGERWLGNSVWEEARQGGLVARDSGAWVAPLGGGATCGLGSIVMVQGNMGLGWHSKVNHWSVVAWWRGGKKGGVW